MIKLIVVELARLRDVLSEFFLIPIVSQQGNSGSCNCKIHVWNNNAHDIVPVTTFSQSENSPIDSCCPDYLALFSQVDVCFGLSKPIIASRFDFDKAKRLLLICNDIDFSRYDRTADVATCRYRVVGGDERKA